MRAISLCLHDVLDVERLRPGDVYTLRLRDFCEHLSELNQRNPAVETIQSRREWGKTQVPVFLTFDDGAAGAYTFAADLLEKQGWRGHFFITTDWVGRDGYMDRHQIRELHSRGHVIGSHSCSHPERMSRLSTQELLREWKDSCAILADIVGCQVRTASVAGGHYSPRVAAAAAPAGIEVLFNSEPTSQATMIAECLVLGRYSIQSFTAPSVSGAIAAGRRWPRWKQSMLWDVKRVLKTIGGEWYVTLRRQFLSRFMPTQQPPRP